METFNFRPIETQDVIDSNLLNSSLPYSGYTAVSKKLDNFIFKEDADFTYSVADKNRFVKFGDTVVDTYGEELIASLLHNTDNGSVTVIENTDNLIHFSTSGDGRIYLTMNFTEGRTYSVSISIENLSSTYLRIDTSDLTATGSAAFNDFIRESETGRYTAVFTALRTISDNIWIRTEYSGEFKVSNISVKETHQTANFENDVPDVRVEGNTAQSTELVTNGNFDTDTTGWTATNFTQSSGVITSATAGSQADQTITTVSGKTYTISFDITANHTDGQNGVYIRNSDGSSYVDFRHSNETGSFSGTFTATGSSMIVRLYNGSTTGTISLDNISVKEVLPAAVTTAAISKGDYVVLDKEELVTNGTFDNDSDWTRQTGWTIGSGVASCDGTQTTLSYIHNAYTFEDGKDYHISCDVTAYTAGSVSVYYHDGVTQRGKVLSSTGRSTLKFTGDGTSNPFGVEASADFIGSIDNISVQQVSDTYRATRDTADMYDRDTTSTSPNCTNGEVIYNLRTDTGIQYHYYLCTTSTGTPPSTVNFGASFKDLGTASAMSLDNPYFQDRTDIGVTNQVLSSHTYNTLTNAYEGITTEVLFEDCYAVESTKTSMLKNGFSQVSDFLYIKGTKLYLPVGRWQTLNKGAYHPWLNPDGVGKLQISSGGSHTDWYSATVMPTYSVADTFLNKTLYSTTSYDFTGIATTKVSAGIRPDSKFYDIVYQDQFIDMREYAKDLTASEQMLVKKDGDVNGVEDRVVIGTIHYETLVTHTTNLMTLTLGVTTGIEIGDIMYHEQTDGSFVKLQVSTYEPTQSTVACVPYDNPDGTWTRTQGLLNVSTLTLPINSQGSKLSNDWIGNPTNYPQNVLDRLASGVSCHFNPLLVGQDGTDYTSGVIYPIAKEKSIKVDFNVLYRISDSAYLNVWGMVIDYMSNEMTGIISNEYIGIASYTSNNNPAQQIDPLPVVSVTDKVFASNSHSIYKGANVGNMLGKIAVGSEYESKVLENTETGKIIHTYINNNAEPFDLSDGMLLYMKGYQSSDGVFEYTYGTPVDNYTPTDDADIDSYGRFTRLSHNYLSTTPKHSPIILDADNGAKWFETICKDSDGTAWAVWNMEELNYDVTFGEDGTFSQLTNGTLTDLNGNSVKTGVFGKCLNYKIKG